MIGDALIKSDNDTTFWMQAMVPKGIKLDMKDLKQQAAMPLASFLRFDPWTDQLIQMHPTFEPIINDRDKMPFEVDAGLPEAHLLQGPRHAQRPSSPRPRRRGATVRRTPSRPPRPPPPAQ